MNAKFIFSLTTLMALSMAPAVQAKAYDCTEVGGDAKTLQLIELEDGKAQAQFEGHDLKGSYVANEDNDLYFQVFNYALVDEQGQTASVNLAITTSFGRGGGGRGGFGGKKTINATLNYQEQETLFGCKIAQVD